MSDVTLPRRQRSIYRVHYGLERATKMAAPFPRLHQYGRQVAGHGSGATDQKYLGLLQCNNGTILKPILKASLKREISFYTRLQDTTDPYLVELKNYVPKYYGCRSFTYDGDEREYIILEDLAQGMLEPCIMDVKIGRRTWDPLATEQKIKNEQSKYAQCKEEYGFCIPGFQVYRLATGKLLKYGKDYGKKLHGTMVKDAIKNYLNAMGAQICRALILQFLSELWKIQRWSSKQTSLRIYSGSVLLIYDARRMKECCGEVAPLSKPKCVPSSNLRRRQSIHSLHSEPGSNFSGQITSTGPVYRKVNSVPITPLKIAQQSFSVPKPTNHSPWNEALERMTNIHSFDNNYDEKLSKMRVDYQEVLDKLSMETENCSPWSTVKIIDFAHAFFNEESERAIDDNFKNGIDNFVSIFEELLKETDDQVFFY